VKRAELRQAIAILKAVGIEELAPHRKTPEPRPTESPDPRAEFLSRVGEIESLLKSSLLPDQVEQANRLLVRIAREASSGRVSNLAMRLTSVMKDDPDQVRVLLARLRSALEENGHQS
jgi:hypothetical protein